MGEVLHIKGIKLENLLSGVVDDRCGDEIFNGVIPIMI